MDQAGVGEYMRKIIVGFFLCFQSVCLFASDWQLDNETSRLSFISTKADNVGEVHSFSQLSGSVDNAGHIEIKIDLASVDTGIELRDQRMRDLFFEVSIYPEATISAKIDPAVIDDLKPGQIETQRINATLELREQKLELELPLLMTLINEDQLMVVCEYPVIISTEQFELADRVEKLRNLARLPSISSAVPVTFSLVFERQPTEN